ncbi:MAG: hypothetical protein K2X39_10140 [Silvanigrellaceae bacterium]|nr:hypothetical protein [Silvanigrellaceae bacterium]
MLKWGIIIFYLNLFFLFLFLIFLLQYYIKKFFITQKKIIYLMRYEKLKQFSSISNCVIEDISAAINESQIDQAYALLPLLLDVKKVGENLANKQFFFHILLFPKLERSIKPQIQRLIRIEKLIKSYPKSEVSLNFSHFTNAQIQG